MSVGWTFSHPDNGMWMSFRYTRISFLDFCRFLVFSTPSVVVVDANPYRKSLAAIHFDYRNTVASR